MTKNVVATSFNLTELGGSGNYESGDPAGGFSVVSSGGTFSDGDTMTITKGLNGFSTGPTIANTLFENFEGGAVGTDVLSSNSNFPIDNADNAHPIRVADPRSGTVCANMYTEGDTGFRQSIMKNPLPSGTTEFFCSFAVKIPTGGYFPGWGGGNSGSNSDYSSNSSWKVSWLVGTNNDSTLNDIAFPNHTSTGNFQLAGNDLQWSLGIGGVNPPWWEWNTWKRFTMWAQADPTNPDTVAGELYFQVADTVDAISEYSSSSVILFDQQLSGAGAPFDWRGWNIPGWIRGPQTGVDAHSPTDVKCYYDDVYYAHSTNASYRVELGNASTYTACSDLAMCDATAWADTEITATCNEGGLNLAAATWLFVVKEKNTVIDSIQVVTP